MPDIRERFGAFDRLDVPDQWDEVNRREPLSSEPTPHLRARKLLVIATAFVLTIAATGLIVRGFHGGAGIAPVNGSPKNWPEGTVPQLGLSFRYPPQWHLQPFNEEIGAAGYRGVLVSNSDQGFQHPSVRPGSFTFAWDLRDLPADGVVISIENVEGTPPPPSPIPDTPLPLSLSDARVLRHPLANPATSPYGRTSERFLSFALNGSVDNIRVFFGPDASASTHRAAAEIVASIRSLSPAPSQSPTSPLSSEATPLNVQRLPGQVDPVCDVTSTTADFGLGGPAPDRAYAFSRLVNGACLNLRASLAMAPDEGAVRSVAAHAAMCHPHCRIIATPDVNGDGVPDVAVGSTAGYADFSLFVAQRAPLAVYLAHVPGGGATEFAVGGTIQSMWGLICTPGPRLTSWGAGETGEGSGPYDVEVTRYRLNVWQLVRVSGDHASVPQGQAGQLPEHGGVALGKTTGICGAPLLPKATP